MSHIRSVQNFVPPNKGILFFSTEWYFFSTLKTVARIHSVAKHFWELLQNSHKNTLLWNPFFRKPKTLVKPTLHSRYFLENFVKVLRAPVLLNTPGWLLLSACYVILRNHFFRPNIYECIDKDSLARSCCMVIRNLFA